MRSCSSTDVVKDASVREHEVAISEKSSNQVGLSGHSSMIIICGHLLDYSHHNLLEVHLQHIFGISLGIMALAFRKLLYL